MTATQNNIGIIIIVKPRKIVKLSFKENLHSINILAQRALLNFLWSFVSRNKNSQYWVHYTGTTEFDDKIMQESLFAHFKEFCWKKTPQKPLNSLMQFLKCAISKHFDHFSYSDYCKVSKVFIQTIHSYQTILSLKL